jgi:hypothetical protein
LNLSCMDAAAQRRREADETAERGGW